MKAAAETKETGGVEGPLQGVCCRRERAEKMIYRAGGKVPQSRHTDDEGP